LLFAIGGCNAPSTSISPPGKASPLKITRAGATFIDKGTGQWQAEDRGKLTFCGKISLDQRGKSVDARYEYRVALDSSQGTFSILPAGHEAAFHPFQFKPEIGQQFLTAVYPVYCGDLGNLICTEWGYGASSLKLTVYRLSENGRIEPVFDGTSRFGFQIINVAGDDLPEICGGYGSLNGPKQMKVYGWDGKKFSLLKTIPVADPQAYTIRRS
jgi:hypothetical protein